MKVSECKSYDDLPLFLSSPQAPYRAPRRKRQGFAHSAVAPLPTKPTGGFAGAPV